MQPNQNGAWGSGQMLKIRMEEKMKINKKTILAAIMALAFAFALSACGGSDDQSNGGDAEAAKELPMEISQEDWNDHREKVDLSTGITMAYVEMGDPEGKPLVLVHGMTDNSRTWSLIAPYFTKAGYHVYIIDDRGHGQTDKPSGFYTVDDYAEDVAAFMEAKGIEKADIIGHSLGSMTMQAFLLLYPEKCNHVVLESTAPVNVDALTTYYYEYGKSLGKDGHPDDQFMKDWYTDAQPVDEEYKQHEMEESQALTGANWESIAGGIAFANMDPFYQYMDDSVPVLILWGTADGFFGTKEIQKQNQKNIPFAEVIKYKGNGHNIQVEIPEQMANDCIEFFNK